MSQLANSPIKSGISLKGTFKTTKKLPHQQAMISLMKAANGMPLQLEFLKLTSRELDNYFYGGFIIIIIIIIYFFFFTI